MYLIEKFDGEDIDGQHLRPPVLAILLETIERENFDGLLASRQYFYPPNNCPIQQLTEQSGPASLRDRQRGVCLGCEVRGGSPRVAPCKCLQTL